MKKKLYNVIFRIKWNFNKQNIQFYLLLYYPQSFFPFINHVLEFIFSKERSLKWYSIKKNQVFFFSI
jgi:hypothetical protein